MRGQKRPPRTSAIDGEQARSYRPASSGVTIKGVRGVKLAYSFLRPLLGAALAGVAMMSVMTWPARPAHAQGQVSLIRDTETERMLRSWLDPILLVAGLQPSAVHLYLVNDPSINAFVAEGQNMFINTGTLMALDRPNQVIGVMAHETGHMADGHLVR